jgi:uncharacterized protein (TIGR04255 family)
MVVQVVCKAREEGEEMVLELQEYPRVVFEKNPLKVVVTQVRFPPVFALEQPAGIAPFQEAIRDEYPVAEARAAQVTVTVGPGGIAVPPTQPGPWRFLNEDSSWVVAAAPDFISLETTAYSRFEDFSARVERLFQSAAASLRLTRRQRLGLRFVNEITHPEALHLSDWRRLLKEELLGIAGGASFGERVAQAAQQIQLELDQGKVTIRHGYTREETSDSVYFLDLDAYDDKAGAFDVEEMLERLAIYHKWVWSIFRSSITDELVDYLKPRSLEDE